MPQDPLVQQTSDDLRMSDFLLLFRKAKKAVGDNLLVCLALPLVCGGLGYFLAATSPVSYRASFYYSIDQPSASESLGISGLLGKFSGGGGDVNANRVAALVRSTTFGRKLLSDTLSILQTPQRVSTLLLEAQPTLLPKNFQASTDTTLHDPLALEHLRRSIFGTIETERNTPVWSGIDENVGLLTLNVEFSDPFVAAGLAELAFTNLRETYLDLELRSSRRNIALFEQKVDSVRSLLSASEIRLARMLDGRKAILRSIDLVEKQRLEKEVQLLSLVASELSTQLETQRVISATTAPTFSVVNPPSFPLPKTEGNVLVMVGQGIAVGIVLALSVVALLGFYRQAKQELGE